MRRPILRAPNEAPASSPRVRREDFAVRMCREASAAGVWGLSGRSSSRMRGEAGRRPLPNPPPQYPLPTHHSPFPFATNALDGDALVRYKTGTLQKCSRWPTLLAASGESDATPPWQPPGRFFFWRVGHGKWVVGRASLSSPTGAPNSIRGGGEGDPVSMTRFMDPLACGSPG